MRKQNKDANYLLFEGVLGKKLSNFQIKFFRDKGLPCVSNILEIGLIFNSKSPDVFLSIDQGNDGLDSWFYLSHKSISSFDCDNNLFIFDRKTPSFCNDTSGVRSLIDCLDERILKIDVMGYDEIEMSIRLCTNSCSFIVSTGEGGWENHEFLIRALGLDDLFILSEREFESVNKNNGLPLLWTKENKAI